MDATVETKAIVRSARKRLGLTQVELAQRLGVISTTVSRWETGAAVPSEPTLRLLVAVEYAERDRREAAKQVEKRLTEEQGPRTLMVRVEKHVREIPVYTYKTDPAKKGARR